MGLDFGLYDIKFFFKCVELLFFIVRDVVYIIFDNFEFCVKIFRIFVEVSLNGGGLFNEGVIGE